MRLMLVRPPLRHSIETEVPKAVEAENQSYPPLALLHLATWLRARSNHVIRILDAQTEHLSETAFADSIRAWKPDVVGISSFTVQLVDVVEAIRTARAAGVRHVVLGGPHCNDFPREACRLPGVDAVVVGEGQLPLAALLDAWENDASIEGIPGVMADPEGPVPAYAYLADDLDGYPIPDRTLVDWRVYSDLIGQGGLFTTVMTSRGCPHGCTFCNTPRHRYRSMSPVRVCDEIQQAMKLGIGEFYFVDDTFNITNERVHGICDEILRRDLRFAWTARMRVKGVEVGLLRKMKAAGCNRLQFGVEQGTQEGLDRLRKGVSLAEVESTFRLTRETGIRTVAYFLIGTPTERNRQDVLHTIDYAVRLRPDFVMFNILTPFPGTVLFDEGVREGVLHLEPWARFMADPRPDFQAQLWTEHFTRDELRDLLHLAWRRFYWRPDFVLRNILQVRRPDDLLRKARAGLRLLTER